VLKLVGFHVCFTLADYQVHFKFIYDLLFCSSEAIRLEVEQSADVLLSGWCGGRSLSAQQNEAAALQRQHRLLVGHVNFSSLHLRFALFSVACSVCTCCNRLHPASVCSESLLRVRR
jgi:hypothetical protein